eukprot:jgi/Mesen1/9223/ME000591S08545
MKAVNLQVLHELDHGCLPLLDVEVLAKPLLPCLQPQRRVLVEAILVPLRAGACLPGGAAHVAELNLIHQVRVDRHLAAPHWEELLILHRHFEEVAQAAVAVAMLAHQFVHPLVVLHTGSAAPLQSLWSRPGRAAAAALPVLVYAPAAATCGRASGGCTTRSPSRLLRRRRPAPGEAPGILGVALLLSAHLLEALLHPAGKGSIPLELLRKQAIPELLPCSLCLLHEHGEGKVAVAVFLEGRGSSGLLHLLLPELERQVVPRVLVSALECCHPLHDCSELVRSQNAEVAD